MEKTKNVIGVIFLIIILLLFSVGGYFAMKYFTTEKNEKVSETKKEVDNNNTVDLRVDKTKDFIYYDNIEDVIASEEIETMDVYFNLASQEELNTLLASEKEAMKKTIKYTKDVSEIPEGVNENDEGIYSLEYRDYQDYEYQNYLSLLIMDYNYDIVNGSIPLEIKSYVIDKNTGKRITGDELLKKYDVTMDDVKSKVREKVTGLQTLNNDIDIEQTMNNFSTFALYINKFGNLEITFVVKSSENSYNINMEINK